MKIYSITEIVKATNNLYNRANNNVKNESLKNIKKQDEPLILSEPIDEISFNEKHNLKQSKETKSIKKKEVTKLCPTQYLEQIPPYWFPKQLQ